MSYLGMQGAGKNSWNRAARKFARDPIAAMTTRALSPAGAALGTANRLAFGRAADAVPIAAPASLSRLTGGILQSAPGRYGTMGAPNVQNMVGDLRDSVGRALGGSAAKTAPEHPSAATIGAIRGYIDPSRALSQAPSYRPTSALESVQRSVNAPEPAWRGRGQPMGPQPQQLGQAAQNVSRAMSRYQAPTRLPFSPFAVS